ncbi:MAG: GNAT family N-acetyltransferase [Colwellia sp.]|nr:GNAT family N-acetyltransferase [Colwellia sp.]
MSSKEYEISFNSPQVEDFANLRLKIGWGAIDLCLAKQSLDNSLFQVAIYHHEKLIAMGRVVGDGFMYFYIQDVIVDPQYQGKGLGNVIMEQIENYLSKAAVKGSTIGLLAAKGKEEFYRKFKYIERSGEPLGKGMCKFI